MTQGTGIRRARTALPLVLAIADYARPESDHERARRQRQLQEVETSLMAVGALTTQQELAWPLALAGGDVTDEDYDVAMDRLSKQMRREAAHLLIQMIFSAFARRWPRLMPSSS